MLADELRRDLYQFIRGQDKPVTREEAAAAVGISRKLAAFHLDKLVEAGLLSARYGASVGRRRTSGRRPKVYEPSGAQISLTIPARRYDLIGEILVDAVAGHPTDAERAALRIAHERGRAIGEAARAEHQLARPGTDRTLRLAQQLLARLGFEPVRAGERLVLLRNCPFHRLAQRQCRLVCGINEAFIDGLLRGLGNETVAAVLNPDPGHCCVELHGP